MTDIKSWTVYTAEPTHGGYWAVWATLWTTEGPQTDQRKMVRDVLRSEAEAQEWARFDQAEYDRIRNISLASLDA